MAGINIIDPNGSDRAISAISAIDPGGGDRTLVQINAIGPDGVDRVVWTPGSSGLAVTATPNIVSGKTRGQGQAVSATTTAFGSGGTAPYTYSWALLSYTNVTPPTIAAPTSATTSFSQTNIGYNESYSATFQVTAKDSVGATATTTVTARWFDISIGGTQ
jgi:hypothetical protein